MALTFRGAGKRLDDIDLPRIGATIGVGEDEIHAVLDVEAAGSGFDKEGRLKALYEPHKAYALSSGKTRDRLVAAGLAYPKWGTKPYPADSYPRILAAMAIDEDIALRSTSWGLGQIMGFNAGAAGYPSARAMVEAFVDDEEVHLEAMVRFIVANGLDDELRRRDWKGFARGYNGAGQVDYYAGKLAAAFAKWAKIPDTPYPPIPTTGSGVKPPPAPAPAVIVAPVIVVPSPAPAEPVPPPPPSAVVPVLPAVDPLPAVPERPNLWAGFLALFSAFRKGTL
ncbi:N-acetylmuramidase family protein [Bosea sp. (in: a-proteobacteria)]|uniref:N-acetylmuramidase family protein n=1 Tax=Bosea sp. (in: a-proteobacteria) TaxID=1871050 RepID=UPI003B3BA2D6